MTHYSRLSKIVVDVPAAVHDTEVAFWRGALGVPLTRFERFPDFHGAELTADGFGLLTQEIKEGEPRVHVDIHTTDRAAEVARLVALGAAVVDDGPHWTVMRDPAGLVFCVVPDPDVDEKTGHRWDL
ncbi:catechol 2,3-dioxygenase-like lactoylglutathione lyase family enzyme [Allocatelliglobosispora scoriae]|uniref:Catechol 2,3-dioxygenase-like lactoylglutathione lyase family enzyme n=1 Tax=Allocatelliglobosispora scoriae TaxID=643052 RepID=A0A841BPC6_9ACTN|nr:VOC family protein [Allocatelliglobosispora scoriae]MBB5868681.1 catechol 2,3-dioxygenase-like lactoylglutathione lyase family enzyme [Allocatelliglobosispora scoriae]